MYTKEITYTNYLGEEKTKKFRFQLTRSELYEIAFSVKGGFIANAQKMIDDSDEPEMFKNTKKIILMAYGEISSDGDRFVKSPEISKAFSETPAYDALFCELMSSETSMRDFVRLVVPPDVSTDIPENFNADSLKELLDGATKTGSAPITATVE